MQKGEKVKEAGFARRMHCLFAWGKQFLARGSLWRWRWRMEEERGEGAGIEESAVGLQALPARWYPRIYHTGTMDKGGRGGVWRPGLVPPGYIKYIMKWHSGNACSMRSRLSTFPLSSLGSRLEATTNRPSYAPSTTVTESIYPWQLHTKAIARAIM